MFVARISGRFRCLRVSALAIGLVVGGAFYSTFAADQKHVVKKSETLSDIAAQYGVTVDTLVKANGLKKPNQIVAGRTLVIPSSTNTTADATPDAASDPSLQRTTVKKNETLSDIARKYGITRQLLIECNDLANPNEIYAGQTLLIPAPQTEKPAPIPNHTSPQSGQKVTVKKSETLSDIASRHGVSVERLARANGIDKPNQIYAGQTLVIPVEVEPEPPPSLDPALQKKLDKTRVKRSRWKYIVIHHSATDEGTVKGMDAYHRERRNMENGLAYHFVIGNGHGMGDGEIAIGNRWTKQLDGGHLHSDALNAISLGICLVGNFDHARPTPKQTESLRTLLAYLLDRCKLKADAVKTHQQINPVFTRCPGNHFALTTVLDGLKEKRVASAAAAGGE